MINLAGRTDDLKNINSLNTINDFIKNDKFT